MPAPRPIERLRITPRSAVMAVALFGATLTAIRLLLASQRVIGWVLAAAAIAGLLYPFVAALARKLPRGLAVLIVVILSLASVGFVGYSVVQGIGRQEAALKRAAPKRAAELERSRRFGKAAREFHLTRRVTAFVDEVPQRLQGGTPADTLRSAATRGIAFLATGILAIFYLLEGPKMARRALDRVSDESRRETLERVAVATYHRGFGYARGTIGMALAAGLFAYLMAKAAGVPGAAPLGLWTGLWDVVPLVGAFLGALPIILLAATATGHKALFVAAAFLGYQLFEAVVLQRPLHKRTVKIGPFLTVAGGFAGVELYGLGGGMLFLLAITLAVTAADELAPDTRVRKPVESAPGADGGEIGEVPVVEVDGRGAAEHLAEEV
jgi:predicted PurR-regulated permease PerM